MGNIKPVGVNDYEIDLFEGQYILEKGMAYNSYVILDEKIAIMDTVDRIAVERWLIPTTATAAVVTGVTPFINIWFSAKIIDLLDTGADAKKLIGYICLAVGINFVLFFLNRYLNDIFFMLRSLLYNRELKNIASKLFSVEFKKLEDSNFKELIHKHAEAQNRVFSAFVQFSWMFRDFVSGALTVIVSVVLIFPLFKIGFQKTGNTFFERPAFLLSIFGAIAVMVVIRKCFFQ